MDHDAVGDNHGEKEGGMSMGVTFLMKFTSPKWELSQSGSGVLHRQGGGENTNNESSKMRLCKCLQLLSREI